MKSIILKYNKNLDLEKLAYKDSDSSKKPVGSKITKAMLYNLLRSLDDDQDNGYNSQNDDDPSDQEENDSTLLVNSATCKDISPTDIRKLLSTSSKKKPTNKTSGKKKTLVNVAKSKSNSSLDNKITINRKTYFSVNSTITYLLSKNMRTHAQLLVDRGANRGVASKDMHVIFTNLDRIISVYEINDHEINSVLMVTTRGVTKSIVGEVIIILNQHTYYDKGKTIHFADQIEYFENLVDNWSIKVREK